MASPIFNGLKLGNAHSRVGSDHASGWAIVPALNFCTCRLGKSDSEREVVRRKAYGMQSETRVGRFAVRGRRGRAVGSHSASIAHAIGGDGFKSHWRVGSIGSAFTVVPGSPNKSVKVFACGSLGRSALRTCSGMASPLFPEQALHAERRLPGR